MINYPFSFLIISLISYFFFFCKNIFHISFYAPLSPHGVVESLNEEKNIFSESFSKNYFEKKKINKKEIQLSRCYFWLVLRRTKGRKAYFRSEIGLGPGSGSVGIRVEQKLTEQRFIIELPN